MKTGIKLHNKFEFEVRDIHTGEVEKAHAENILLDRIYERLCNFNPFFTQIVFGSGSGTPTPDRITLFNRIGSKAATTVVAEKDTPTCIWTRKINLGIGEFNGQTITEVGISDGNGINNMNTHAMLTDSEGNPITIEKTDTKIIDIYATIYIEIYDVDSGLAWRGDGLRNYLTGGSAPSNTVSIGLHDAIGNSSVTGTRTADVGNKKTKIDARFGINDYNSEVKYINWAGLECRLPRTGVYTGTQKTDVNIGVGDGSNKAFALPQHYIKNIIMKVDGIVNNNWSRKNNGDIEFEIPPADGLLVTASYFCSLFPKDKDHLLDITMEIGWGQGKPTPVVSPEIAPIGNMELIAGDYTTGFYGEVPSIINGVDLARALNMTQGISHNDDVEWLKFARDGKCILIPKKTLRHSTGGYYAFYNESQNIIPIVHNGIAFSVAMMSESIWRRFIMPCYSENGGQFTNYSAEDLGCNSSQDGRNTGINEWVSSGSSAGYNYYQSHLNIMGTKYISPVTSGGLAPIRGTASGWRPVLEYITT